VSDSSPHHQPVKPYRVLPLPLQPQMVTGGTSSVPKLGLGWWYIMVREDMLLAKSWSRRYRKWLCMNTSAPSVGSNSS
jgi:hypothetical protein